MRSTNPIRRGQSHPDPVGNAHQPSADHPAHRLRARQSTDRRPLAAKPRTPESVDDVLAAFGDVSRRITDLARELDCLGYFDDPNGDLPRAA
jgi:hypothetical protein